MGNVKILQLNRESKHRRVKRSSQQIAGQRAAAGFTLIELLVVIVVIAILASIAVVSYRGIQGRAAATVLQSDVRSSGNQLEIGMATDGQYPGSSSDLPKSPGTDYEYDSDGNSYCLTATSSKSPKAYYISNESGGVKEGACPGHSGPSNGGGGNNTIADNSPIQNMTQTHCSNLAVYDGTNQNALVKLTDSRGGTTRTYTVGKLADGNCWMLDNLKLGSTTGTITLTPADSDVASNFTLPQLTTSGSADHDNSPGVYGPVPGDTGSGATNYGYLYNWPAVTAGESRTSHDQNAGNAPQSICSKGWRLPAGGSTGEFAMLNAKMNNPTATSPSISSGTGYYQNWQFTGLFRGALTGGWWGGFSYQGEEGNLWSSSSHPDNITYAFRAFISPNYIYPDNGDWRFSGHGVRCLLN